MKKTYKRETAFLILLYLMYLGLFGTIEALTIVIWPFMLFVGTAFGMDWASSQTDLVRKVLKEDGNK